MEHIYVYMIIQLIKGKCGFKSVQEMRYKAILVCRQVSVQT